MKIFEKINQTFSFTQTERRVVLFLVIAFIAGIGIKLYKAVYPAAQRFDYAAIDSEFNARSNPAQSQDSIINADGTDTANIRAGSAGSVGKTNEPVLTRIDINKASQQELSKLPGIGDVMATRIVTFRKEKGSFKTIRDLMKVKGIGKKKFERLAPYIVVEK
jgi:comEA protein